MNAQYIYNILFNILDVIYTSTAFLQEILMVFIIIIISIIINKAAIL